MEEASHTQGTAIAGLPDPELVRLLLAGNHEAMTVIFNRYWRLMMSVALHILHDTSEAEDVVQLVFTEFYERAHLFDPAKGNLRNWLLQYAYGRSFNHKRSLKSRGYFQQVEVEEAESGPRAVTSETTAKIESQDAAILVEQILPHLSRKQRTVIEKAFFEGKRLDEVAEEIGEAIGNVRHSYYRGLDKLRSLLGGSLKRTPIEPNSAKQRFWLKRPRNSAGALEGEVDIV